MGWSFLLKTRYGVEKLEFCMGSEFPAFFVTFISLSNANVIANFLANFSPKRDMGWIFYIINIHIILLIHYIIRVCVRVRA